MKKLLPILLLILPLVGCSTAPAQRIDEVAPAPVYEGLSPYDIQAELVPRLLFADDVSGITFFDRRYVSVTKEMAEKWAGAAFKKVDQTYVAEVHDCDDKVWEFLVFLRREAIRTHPKMEHALIAGLAAVTITQPIPELGIEFTGGHALVLIRVRGGTWWLLEPATGRGTKLDEELFDGRLELNGVWF